MGARTLEVRVIAVVDVFVRPGSAAQEALLVRLVHVDEELRVAVELLPTEPTAGVALTMQADHVQPKPCCAQAESDAGVGSVRQG